MNFNPPNQLKFEWDLPEDESSSALSAEEIQYRKDLSEAFIRDPKHWEKDKEGKPIKPYWLDHAIDLHEGKMRFPFRAAVLAAWLATPKKYRVPKTQDELADLLGLSSDRQFTVWMARNPQIRAVAHTVWRERALDHLNDSMEAMFEVAARPDYKSKGHLELHLKVAGILSDKLVIENPSDVDLSKLSFNEKLKLAGLDTPEALAAWRAEVEKKRNTEIGDTLEEANNKEDLGDVPTDGSDT